MRQIHPLVFAVLCLAPLPLPVHAAEVHYLGLLNRAHDSVVALEVAPAGSEAFVAQPIHALAGGGNSTTVRLGAPGCRFDLRLQFGNGRRAVYRAVDACKGDTLVIQPLPRGRNDAAVALQAPAAAPRR